MREEMVVVMTRVERENRWSFGGWPERLSAA